MPLAVLLLGLVPSVAFEGGDADRFATWLSKTLEKPVVLLVDDGMRIASFSSEANSVPVFLESLRSQSHWIFKGEQGLGGSLEWWPSRVYTRRYALGKGPKYMEEPFPPTARDGGTITLHQSDGKALNVGALAREKWSKPLVVGTFYQPFQVVAACQRTSEKVFLEAVAAAIGAKFVDTPTAYRFDFAPSVYRERLKNAFGDENPFDTKRPADREFALAREKMIMAALAAISDEEFAELHKAADPDAAILLDIPNDGALHDSANGMLKTYRAFAAEMKKAKQTADWDTLQILNPQLPMKIYVTRDSYSLAVRTTDGGTALI